MVRMVGKERRLFYDEFGRLLIGEEVDRVSFMLRQAWVTRCSSRERGREIENM